MALDVGRRRWMLAKCEATERQDPKKNKNKTKQKANERKTTATAARNGNQRGRVVPLLVFLFSSSETNSVARFEGKSKFHHNYRIFFATSRLNVGCRRSVNVCVCVCWKWREKAKQKTVGVPELDLHGMVINSWARPALVHYCCYPFSPYSSSVRRATTRAPPPRPPFCFRFHPILRPPPFVAASVVRCDLHCTGARGERRCLANTERTTCAPEPPSKKETR